MSRLHVAPIVEGHGEVESIRILLCRIWDEIVGGEFIGVMRPIRVPRGKIVKKPELRRAILLARMNLQDVREPEDPRLVLVLMDADDDPPCVLGPRLYSEAQEDQPPMNIACVIANVEYETWFVAAAESLTEFLHLDAAGSIPDDPESERAGKGWIQRRFRGTKYSETVDQPRMTDKMDLSVCRERAPSFDKLCRELEKRS